MLSAAIGPVVAGVSLTAFGMVACFALNGLSFLFVIAAVLALRNVHVPSMAAESMVVQFKSGLRFARGSPTVITVAALGFSGAFLGWPLLTFLPVITRDVFHQDVTLYTRLMAFSGAGAVTGALVVAWAGPNRRMGRMMLRSLALFGTMMVAFALSRTIFLSALILFIAGALLVMCFSLANSLAHLLAPPELRGRVVSYYLAAFMGGSPLGGLASGWLVTKAGSAPMMLMINGTALTLVALYCLIQRHDLANI
jgi:predicted MFS family arabinose efflux permease